MPSMTLWEIMDVLYRHGELEAYEALKAHINALPAQALEEDKKEEEDK